jgi:hypothetical protein
MKNNNNNINYFKILELLGIEEEIPIAIFQI